MAEINVVLQALKEEVGDRIIENAMLKAEVTELQQFLAEAQAELKELKGEEE